MPALLTTSSLLSNIIPSLHTYFNVFFVLLFDVSYLPHVFFIFF